MFNTANDISEELHGYWKNMTNAIHKNMYWMRLKYVLLSSHLCLDSVFMLHINTCNYTFYTQCIDPVLLRENA